MMGQLVNGEWSTEWYDTKSTNGRFERSTSGFRNWITPDGVAGPSGVGGFTAEAGRYHLYISHACPWAHRTMIFRKLKALEDLISISVVDPKMPDETGWQFGSTANGTTNDLHNAEYLWQIYVKTDPQISGRVTVPVLWDKQQNTIVSNESSEIIRMFNSAFNNITGNTDDYYPAALHDVINTVNARIYDDVNNGVYKAGFATTQDAYDEAVTALFDTLDWAEDRLTQHAYLTGNTLTEADWRLFTTLVRFDAVYFGHFKCDKRRIADYPGLSRLLTTLYKTPGIADTVHMDHIRTHYYWSHTTINPHRIVPIGQELAFMD